MNEQSTAVNRLYHVDFCNTHHKYRVPLVVNILIFILTLSYMHLTHVLMHVQVGKVPAGLASH
jgi:hypothetical protein